MKTSIFVFGSNRLGIHKRGAAKDALIDHGAILGQGEGIQGSSYAIPTKADPSHSLSLLEIEGHVFTFLEFARAYPELDFQVTRIGCGLAGYNDVDIAPMFAHAPANCHLPDGWREKH